MKVDQALQRMGVEIVHGTNTESGAVVLDLRVSLQGRTPDIWKRFIADILPVAEQSKKWQLEISKRFFSRGTQVLYLWRMCMTGDIKTCQVAVVAAAISALREGVNVHEVPLVGLDSRKADPRNGTFRGAYANNEAASRAISSSFTP